MLKRIELGGHEIDQTIVKKVIYNGRLVSKNQPLFSSGNRAFRYGDSLFESMRFADNQVFWLEKHIKRLHEGMEFLGYANPKSFSADFLRTQIAKLELKGPARIRLAVFRSGAGTYRPETDDFDYLIEAESLKEFTYSINGKGLHCGIFESLHLSGNKLENIKSSNRLIQVLASKFANENGFDDALVLHASGQIAEATASNLFVVGENQLVTPPLASGCLAGIMRSLLIEIGIELGYTVSEQAIYPDFIKESDAVWLTNSISGIRWIKKLEGMEFPKGPIQEFTRKLNEKIHQK